MSVQNDVHAEHENQRHKKIRRVLQDGVVLRLIHAVVGFGFQLFGGGLAVLAAGYAQQNQHRAGGNEQHVRFAQSVKCAVVQNHARNDVDRAGFLHALLDIALADFVVDRVVGIAERRQVAGRLQQHPDDGKAHNHRQQTVQPRQQLLAARVRPLMVALVQRLVLVQALLTVLLEFRFAGKRVLRVGQHVLFTAFVQFVRHGVIEQTRTAVQPLQQLRKPAFFIIIPDLRHAASPLPERCLWSCPCPFGCRWRGFSSASRTEAGL